VGSGQGGEVCELREDEAKLMVGSAWAERLRRCGATVSFELAGVQMDGGGVLGSGGGEKARKRGEWNADILLMLMRTRGGDLGLRLRLATAAVKWRPWSSAGAAWRGEGAPARGKEGGVESGRDAWETTASRRWPGLSTAGGRR